MKTVIAALLAASVAVAASAAQGQQQGGRGSDELHQIMTRGAQEMQSMTMTGEVDRDFVQGMIMHHRHGIEMARIAVEQGTDQKVKDLARRIMDGQQRELKQLESWHSGQRGSSQQRR